MKINTSQISMDASAEHKDVTGRYQERLAGARGEEPEFRLRLNGIKDYREDRVEANSQSQELCATSSVRCPEGETRYETQAEQVVEQMVGQVMAQRVRLRRIDGLQSGAKVVLTEPLNPPGQQVAFSITSHSFEYEYEKVSVRSAGSVQLADGREIDFSLNLSMERESLIRESVAWQAAGGILMDPLTLNFDCDLRSLANKSFQFDLNCDGEKEELSSLQPGSGFLALDLNDDRKINDGQELFGPTSGHGFAELAMHDSDFNGWIDENDPVFAKLLIWQPEEAGESRLLTLAEAGVGAICLTHDINSFQLKDQKNRLMGEVAATGIFLTEDGEVRAMQEIKLALQGVKGEDKAAAGDQQQLDSQIFIMQMIAVRQAELQALARLRLSRREQNREHDLLATLFPDWQKERGLPSVEARMEKSLLG